MKRPEFRLIAVFISVFLSAQVRAQAPFQAGFHFSMGLPQNEFDHNISNQGFGFSGYFQYNLPRTPFFVGAGISYLIYGSETRQEPFSTTIPDVMVDVRTTNSILQTHLMCRVQPTDDLNARALSPYIEGLVGFNYLWTETKVEDFDEFWDEYDDVASSTNYDDYAFSYGGGGGFTIRVYDGRDNEMQKIHSVSVEIGARYIPGGEADYLKEGDIQRENGKVTYNPSTSRTDLMTFHLGVNIRF